MTTETDIAYCAGLMDGEAYIGVKRTAPYASQGKVTPGFHARIQIRMVDEAAIRFIAETFGGWYYPEKAHSHKGRPLFCYQAADASAERILRTVLPYLRVKRASADTVLALRDLQATSRQHRTKVVGERNFPNQYGAMRTVQNRSLSDEYIGRCVSLYERCKELNHVGIDAP